MNGGGDNFWEQFEQRRRPLFLATGGLWLLAGMVSAVHTRVDRVLDIHLGDPAGVLMFLAMTVSFGCILALYPQVADRAPRSAIGGAVIGAFTFVSQAIWLLVSAISLTWPTNLAPQLGFSSPLAFVWAAGFLVYPIAFAVYGIASLRSAVYSRVVSYLLISPLVIWFVSGGASLYIGEYAGPVGTAGVTLIGMAAIFLAIGYLVEAA